MGTILEKSLEAILAILTGNPVKSERHRNIVMKDIADNIRSTTNHPGVVELATSAEAVAGTDTARAVTPSGLAAALAAGLADSLDTEQTAGFLRVKHIQIANAAAASATAVLEATALAADTQMLDEGFTSPDVPRTLTAKGNAEGVVGNVTITGTNVDDDLITDTIALNGTTEVEGIKAFKTVTHVLLPAETHAGTDTVSVGIGKKFGLPEIIANASLLLVKLFNGSTDSGTLAVDADEVEKNLFALNGTPDGAKDTDLYYLVP